MGEIIFKTLAAAILSVFVIVGIIGIILRLRSNYRWYDNLPRNRRLTKQDLKHLKRINDATL